jgi:murein L,D-transpeptidase YcbB/YkuD
MGALICCQAAQASEGLLWFRDGRPSTSARQAVDLLASAAGHGLDARDYAVPRARQALSGGARVPPADPSTLAAIDGELTAAMERYLAHLHHGRVDPRTIHHDFSRTAVDPFDAAKHLRAALASGELAQAVRTAAPGLPQYDSLRTALGRYRELIGHEAWQQPLAPLPAAPQGRSRVLKAGATYDDLPRLADRLAALGDLPAHLERFVKYEGALVDAIRRFQHRHGLPVDGHLGTSTFAQLQVTPAARARQIELTLERLRWTPLLRGRRMVLINVPEFVLRAYEVQDGRIHGREEMKVVVGKALRTRTPLFDEDMRFIEFSPYWNVPPSIARGELVPRLRRDPGYFLRQGFEFVGADGRVETRLTGAGLDAVLAGKWRIRQRPGPQNALGDIKFVFPNSDNIYLHHTPATELFERERRDFSHGCIRVEKPVALARFVLAGHRDWNEDRIRAAMSAGQSTTLRLAEPVPVVIAYGTALVKQGSLHFFDDIYGLDRSLDAALRARPSTH